MKPRVLLITALSIIALVVGLVTAVSLVKQRQVVDAPAAVPSGTSTINITPSSPSLFVGQQTTLTANLNTGNVPISAYQIIASYTYTGTTAPIEILGNEVSIVNTSLDDCLLNTITHDTSARRFTISVACSVPLVSPQVPYNNNADTPIFTFNVRANSVGNVTLAFDNVNSIVTSADGNSNDILTFPTNIQVTSSADTQAPAAISNLSINNPTLNSLNLSWSAPTDSGPSGRAATYEIRYSTSTITSGNWNSATLATNPPAAGNPGTNQTYTLSGLNSNTTYFVAVRSRDAAGNLSGLSNVASAATQANPTLSMSFRMQGSSSPNITRNVSVTLKQNGTSVPNFTNVNVSTISNAQGVFTGTLPNVPAGTYDVIIKGPVHLGKLVSGIQLAVGSNTVNWPATAPVLLAGDINGSNVVDIIDYSLLAGQFAPGVNKTSTSDLNFNNIVDIIDYSILAGNFGPGVRGDE